MLKLVTDEDLRNFIGPYEISEPGPVSLANFDPADTGSLDKEFKEEAQGLLAKGIEWMSEQQPMLAASDQRSLLLIFQGRDAAGKDSMIRHVMSGLNPAGCRVRSFKQPHYEDLDHDYLRRYHKHVPMRGEIGIFNRSHYEEVLVVRVHPELLETQKLPRELITPEIWQERLEDINNFERYLSRNGVHILKFFLDVSREEQKERFLKRLDQPDKHWKFAPADIDERAFWDDYTLAFEEAIGRTARPYAPWYVVPSDRKWFSRLVVATAVVSKLREMKLEYPEISTEARQYFKKARQALKS